MESYCPQFILKQVRALTGLRQHLHGYGYRLGPARMSSGQREIYDTFDWRLFNKRLLLGHDPDADEELFLFNAADAGMISQGKTTTVGRFLHQLDCAAIAARLAPVIEERALICQGRFELRKEKRDISDNQGKIVARLSVERLAKPAAAGKTAGRPLRVVRVQALKGYERKTNKLFTRIRGYCNSSGSPGNLLAGYYTTLGRTAGDYSSKLMVQLDRSMTIRQALSIILLSQLDMMERNIPGLRDDTDTEFLHDFRIANRRSRSLITGMKQVLPASSLESGRQFFSWISKQTSTLRDVDVFLLAFRQYEQLLPAEMYAQLLPLQEFLQQRKEAERKSLLAALESDRFRGFIRAWRESLQECAGGEDTTGPVLNAAGGAIWKVWKKTGKQGRAASGSSSDEALHELRKTAKKLRYLLEAFRTLFPAKDVERAIRQLRKLQNVLGDIVDYQVQQQYLGQWQENFPGKQHRGVKTAMEFLGREYARRESATKKVFQRHYDAFVAEKNKELFRSLRGKASS